MFTVTVDRGQRSADAGCDRRPGGDQRGRRPADGEPRGHFGGRRRDRRRCGHRDRATTPALIPNPTVTYTSPNATGSLAYTPVANAYGTAIITVTVTDAGLDDNLATPGDNLTVTARSP